MRDFSSTFVGCSPPSVPNEEDGRPVLYIFFFSFDACLNSPRCCLARSAMRWIAPHSRPGICGHIARSPEWASPLRSPSPPPSPSSPPPSGLESKALLIFEVKGLHAPPPPLLLLLLLLLGGAVGGRVVRPTLLAFYGGGITPCLTRCGARSRSTTNMKWRYLSAVSGLSPICAQSMKSARFCHPKYILYICILQPIQTRISSLAQSDAILAPFQLLGSKSSDMELNLNRRCPNDFGSSLNMRV